MNTNIQYQFQNKVVFITGASNGIGRATALAFAEAGAQVALVDVNEDAGGMLAQAIQSKGQKAQFFQCDVAVESEVQQAVQKTVQAFGGFDYAFNNAGIEGQQSPTAEASSANWERVLQVNLSGVWYGMKYQIQEMLKRGGGSIVNCSSIAGLIGFPGISPYVASKHAVLGLTKTAALEYAKSNIRINAVCPGVIQTPMIDRFTQGQKQAAYQLVAGEPIGRMGRPEEIAATVLWLSSDASSFVTGHSLVADGGWVAQ